MFAVSPLIQLTISADLRPQIRNPHTSLHVHCSRHSAVSAHASAVAPNRTMPTRSPRNAITVYWDLGALRFLSCILWLNDTSYSKSVKRDEQELWCQDHVGTTFSAVHRPWEPQCTTSQTDGRTTGRCQ